MGAFHHTFKDSTGGAGEGNRTLVVSLEGFCSTIELHPPVHVRQSRTAATPATGWALEPTRKNPIFRVYFMYLVEGEGFEPSKAEPSDLQSDPFDRSGTPPNETINFAYLILICQSFIDNPRKYAKCDELYVSRRQTSTKNNQAGRR